MTTGEVIGVLRAIEHKVWEHDIPHPGTCAEYREHHKACLDILKYIRGYIDLIKKIRWHSFNPGYVSYNARNNVQRCGSGSH